MSANASAPVGLLLNGQRIGLDTELPHSTLLDFLRERGLTGAKEGCAEGECGACTVVVVADTAGRPAYRPVNSCLMPLPLAAGHEIYTVESLATGGAALADVQRVMADAGGSQCGYCTPGFVMSLFAEQYRPGRTGPCDPMALSGNLCRCTGYRPIRDAALALGPPPPGVFRDRLDRLAPVLAPVASTAFSRPGSVEACVEILAAHPDATLVGGGTDLGVDANLHGRRWTHLVSVEAIDEMREYLDTGHSIRIGAALPLTDLGHRWADAPDAIQAWLTLFASPPIRNRATLGGNLATASPIGDAAPILLALDAAVRTAGPSGKRSLPLSTFFSGYRRTTLAAGEIIITIEIPKPLPRLLRFYKVSKRRLDDISTVAAGMAMDWDDAGRVRRARFAFGGVAATPLRITEAEEAVRGHFWTEASVDRAQDVFDRTLTPLTDVRGSKEYRREVAKSLVARFFAERPS